jgi:hypothetical protein
MSNRTHPGGEGESAGGLSGPQRTAIEWLTAGETAVAAADAAGVSRSTVHRWLRADPAFQAAYNAWQADLTSTARARLLALADKAVSTVERALDRGDARTALTILRAQGLLGPARPGPTDPDLIARQQSHDRALANFKMTDAECGVPAEIFDPATGPRPALASLPVLTSLPATPNDRSNDPDRHAIEMARFDECLPDVDQG